MYFNTEYMDHLDKEQVIAFLASRKSEMQERFGIIKIGLFGSYARGDARNDSDIDIAVEISGDGISDKYFGALHYLEDNLQGKGRSQLLSLEASGDLIKKK